MTNDNVVPCESCGCLGNQSCGHEIMDKDKCCALDHLLICPCCRIAGGASHLRQPEDPRQIILIAEGEEE
jgi:hypothetical protein